MRVRNAHKALTAWRIDVKQVSFEHQWTSVVHSPLRLNSIAFCSTLFSGGFVVTFNHCVASELEHQAEVVFRRFAEALAEWFPAGADEGFLHVLQDKQLFLFKLWRRQTLFCLQGSSWQLCGNVRSGRNRSKQIVSLVDLLPRLKIDREKVKQKFWRRSEILGVLSRKYRQFATKLERETDRTVCFYLCEWSSNTREVPMKSACVHVVLAKCWSYQTGLCQGIKHISRMADNYFIVPHKPNMLSTGFRTFAVMVKVAKKLHYPHLIFILYHQCIHFVLNLYILILLTEKKVE